MVWILGSERERVYRVSRELWRIRDKLMIKTIKGQFNDVRMEIELPDDMPEGDKLRIVRKLQEIADLFDSAAELGKKMDEVAAKLGLEMWRTH